MGKFLFPVTSVRNPVATVDYTTDTLTYASNGDTNGLIHWLGTALGMTSFSNPAPAVISLSIPNPGVIGVPESTTDEDPSEWVSEEVANTYLKVDLGPTRHMMVTDYVLQNRNSGNHALRNWKLQGSNDGSVWIDLDIRVSDSTIANTGLAYGHFTCSVGDTTPYRHLRIIITGVDADGQNYIALAEMEFYGELTRPV